MMHVSRPRLSSAVLLLLGGLAACHHGSGSGGQPDGGATGPGPHGTPLSLTITPASPTMTVTDLANLPSTTLAATVSYADNTTAPVVASWTVDRYDIAQVGAASGVLNAVGNAYGPVQITANADGLTATASALVQLKLVSNPGMATTDQQALLDGASTSDPTIGGLSYPYDKTVFPRALLAPEMMWSGGQDADLYRVHATAASFDVTVYTAAANPSRFTLDQGLWTALGASAAPGDVTIELRRMTGGDAYVSATQTWTIADANLRGSIYYWDAGQGELITLDVSSGNRVSTFVNGDPTVVGTPVPLNSGMPDSPPWQAAGPTNAEHRCVACHAVSKDGSHLGSVFSRGLPGSTGPYGTIDLASQSIVAISDYTRNGIWEALNPDGSRIVANYDTKTMQLLDSTTGAAIPSALDGVANLCDPTFSPDGSLFAVAGNCDPGFGYPVEYRTADLQTYAFDQATSTFSNLQTVVKSAGVGDAIAFPSFTPDSQHIVFQRGDYARAKYATGTAPNTVNAHGVDDLYITGIAPGAAVIALDNANGKGVLSAANMHLNYDPTVNPIAEGGYAWVVFVSPRDYGNRMVTPAGSDVSYTNHKQLWVAAVDLATGTTDPSHPAFWLPGQDPTSINMFGYWSLSPCKATAPAGGGTSSCAAGYECCSGFCRAGGPSDGGAGEVCVDAPSGCSQTGEKCTTSGDCCSSGDACNGGICQGATIL